MACQIGNRIPALSETPTDEKESYWERSDERGAAQSAHPRSAATRFLAALSINAARLVAGNIGEYHFDCPLDNMLFGFKGVKGDDFKAQIEQGASDQEIVEWLNQSGRKENAGGNQTLG